MSDEAVSEPCPCGTALPFAECCGPILSGTPAPTAVALMRSRYTAYAKGAIDHILDTHAPDVRKDVDRAETERWSKEHRWLGLTIVASEAGGADDERGVVEFIARYGAGEHELKHHERSTFRKEEGRWYFVDGQIVKPPPMVREAPKVGRNDPCPCGSNKKYKKCHGA